MKEFWVTAVTRVSNVLMPFILGGICGALVASLQVREEDYAKFAQEQAEERADRCCYEEQRPGAFAPGIIGVQRCGFDKRWSDMKCEPDPRYRVTTEASP